MQFPWYVACNSLDMLHLKCLQEGLEDGTTPYGTRSRFLQLHMIPEFYGRPLRRHALDLFIFLFWFYWFSIITLEFHVFIFSLILLKHGWKTEHVIESILWSKQYWLSSHHGITVKRSHATAVKHCSEYGRRTNWNVFASLWWGLHPSPDWLGSA